MLSSFDHISTFFASYEEREDAFSRAVAFKLARRYAGPSIFWQEFSRISRQSTETQKNDHTAYIPSNPRDCLAFGTPRQVLMASQMSAGRTGAAATAGVMDTACRFHILDQLSQPIRTLSGGETVKLALAKTSVDLAACSRVVIASPFTWLSESNRHLLEDIVTQAHDMPRQIAILALTGEEDLIPIRETDPFLTPRPGTIPFTLTLSEIRIPLSVSLHPLAAEAAHAAIENSSLTLASPCLILGNNGQGKKPSGPNHRQCRFLQRKCRDRRSCVGKTSLSPVSGCIDPDHAAILFRPRRRHGRQTRGPRPKMLW